MGNHRWSHSLPVGKKRHVLEIHHLYYTPLVSNNPNQGTTFFSLESNLDEYLGADKFLLDLADFDGSTSTSAQEVSLLIKWI